MRIRSIAPALGLAALGLSIAAVPAASADYPVLRGSQIEDVPPPPSDYFSGGFNWTGFYVGGLVGGTQTRFETDRGLFELARFAYNATTIGNQFNPDALVISRPTRDSGPSYGGYIGYNLAFGDAMIGIEADYSRLDQRVAASTFEARRIGIGERVPDGVLLVAVVGVVLLVLAVRSGRRRGRAHVDGTNTAEREGV